MMCLSAVLGVHNICVIKRLGNESESRPLFHLNPSVTIHRIYWYADLLDPMLDCGWRGAVGVSRVVIETQILMVKGKRILRLHLRWPH